MLRERCRQRAYKERRATQRAHDECDAAAVLLQLRERGLAHAQDIVDTLEDDMPAEHSTKGEEGMAIRMEEQADARTLLVVGRQRPSLTREADWR